MVLAPRHWLLEKTPAPLELLMKHGIKVSAKVRVPHHTQHHTQPSFPWQKLRGELAHLALLPAMARVEVECWYRTGRLRTLGPAKRHPQGLVACGLCEDWSLPAGALLLDRGLSDSRPVSALLVARWRHL